MLIVQYRVVFLFVGIFILTFICFSIKSSIYTKLYTAVYCKLQDCVRFTLKLATFDGNFMPLLITSNKHTLSHPFWCNWPTAQRACKLHCTCSHLVELHDFIEHKNCVADEKFRDLVGILNYTRTFFGVQQNKSFTSLLHI